MTKIRTEVRSQAEFDACIKLENIAVVINASVEARGNASVEARGNASVEAWGNASVEARENASVEARENASVVALGNASVVARGNASVEARGNASVVALGNASVVALGNASVVAWGNASVVALGNASVVAWENASAVARGNASVVARENASVEAWENASVVATGNVFIRLWSALKIKATLSVAIMVHGPAKEIEGGGQIKAMKPEIGSQWCEYFGIDPANAPFVIPNIDAAILESIEANKAAGTNGLNMGSWHGRECDETNWCNTTHCRAGYAICLAGKAGFELERRVGPETAGQMIYAASRPDNPLPDFHASDEDAMADMVANAGAV
jgi:hypothetical protein